MPTDRGQMLATVLDAPGDFSTRQVDVPRIAPDEALIRVAACGVCGSDIPRMMTKGAHRLPLVTGHEFSGTVVELGAEVTTAAVGDVVTVPPLLPCWRCAACESGQYGMCSDYDYFGSRRDGAYTTYVAVPHRNLVVVPDGVDPLAAAMVDPSAIALHALQQTRVGPGRRVAVLGAGGPIGLFAVQWARLMGATDVLGVEVSEPKHPLIEQAGASMILAGASQVERAAGDAGYDVLVDCTGVPAAIDLAAAISGRRAEAVFIGIPTEDVTFSLASFSRFLRNEVRLKGSWNSFSVPFPGTAWTATLEAMAAGRLKWEFMITHRRPMAAVPETIREMAAGLPSSKVLFVPEEG